MNPDVILSIQFFIVFNYILIKICNIGLVHLFSIEFFWHFFFISIWLPTDVFFFSLKNLFMIVASNTIKHKTKLRSKVIQKALLIRFFKNAFIRISVLRQFAIKYKIQIRFVYSRSNQF